MTPMAQRIAVLQALGWEQRTEGLFWHPVRHEARILQDSALWETRKKMGLPMDTCGLPDPLSDLNVMHEAEMTLTEQQKVDYVRILRKGFGAQCPDLDSLIAATFAATFATAAQRADAFIWTIVEWKYDHENPDTNNVAGT